MIFDNKQYSQEEVPAWLVLLLLFILPFYFGQIDLLNQLIQTALSCVLLFSLLKSNNKLYFSADNPLIPLMLLAFYALSGIVTSISTYASLLGAIKLFNYAIVFWVMINIFSYKHYSDKHVRLYFFFVTALCFFALGQYLLGSGHFHHYGTVRVHAFFGTPNLFALYIAMNFMFVLTIYLFTTKRIALFYSIVSLFFLVLTLALTYSRTGWVVCLFMLLIFFVLAICKKTIRSSLYSKRILFLFLTAGCCLFGFILYTVFQTKGILFTRLISLLKPFSTATFIERTYFWKSALLGALHHLPFGAGCETFFLLYPSYKGPELQDAIAFFAHNDYLQILSELGLPGLFLFIWFLCASLVTGFKAYQKGALSGVLSIVLVLGFILSAVVEFSFYFPGIFLIVLASIAYAYPSALTNKKYLSSTFTKIVEIILCVVISMFLIFTVFAYMSQCFNKKGTRKLYAGDFEVALQYFSLANRFLPLYADNHLTLGYNNTLFYNLQGYKGITDLTEKEIKQALVLSPHKVRSYELAGRLYLANFEHLSCVQKKDCLYFLMKASELSPQEPRHKIHLQYFWDLVSEKK